jgi:hypothetical protein
MNVHTFFYLIKPLIPRKIQIIIRKKIIKKKYEKVKDVWPIKEDAGRKPEDWNGWPDGKKCALILTHDVETEYGLNKCLDLAEVEKSLELYSSFNFVPERYVTPQSLRCKLRDLGFEIGVHDLNHDGRLFSSYKLFKERSKRINYFLKKWNACGFRAGSMYHNLDWIGELEILYDCSTFDTDPFEPQPDGVGTIFPFTVKKRFSNGTFVELPYTLPQDFLLFILMKNHDIDIWKRKVDWIFEKNGMILVNTHPDYMNFENKYLESEYPIKNYFDLLEYISSNYRGQFINLLPKELAILVNKKEYQIN